MRLIKFISIIITLFIVNNCASTLPSTDASRTEMNEADTVIINVDYSPDEAYRQIAQILNDRGYTFSSTDAILRIISTEYRTNEGFFSYDFKISASVRNTNGTQIILRGTIKRQAFMGEREFEVSNNATNNMDRQVWDRLVEIAGEFSNSEIMYKRS